MTNHFLHTLTPLLLLTSFVLSLLTLLSPTTIFHSEVALLVLTGTRTQSGSSAATSSTARASSTTTSVKAKSTPTQASSIIDPARSSAVRMHKVRRAIEAIGIEKRDSSIPVSSKMFFGPMGACYAVDSDSPSDNLKCSAPSFTPIFAIIYDDLNLPSTSTSILPQQFPLAPTALFLSTLLLAIAFLGSLFSSLPLHSKKFAKLEGHKKGLVKIGVIAGAIGIIIGFIATISWRVQLGNVVNDFKGDDIFSSASLGNALNMMWASLSIGLVAFFGSTIALARA